MKSENAILYPAPEDDLISWYGKLQEEVGLKPYVKFSETHKYLSQLSHRIGENQLYFIANTSLSENIIVEAEFGVEAKYRPWIWNPETGEKMLYPTKESNNKFQLELSRATSLIIVFEEEAKGVEFQVVDNNTGSKEITGSWKLQLKHMNGEKEEFEIDALSDLIEVEETKEFAGEVIYEKTITIDSDRIQFIDLGKVEGVSELTVNGKLLGAKWYGGHRYEIGDALKQGENKLSMKLTTIMGNYMKSLVGNQVAMDWTRRQPHSSMGIMGPVRLIKSSR